MEFEKPPRIEQEGKNRERLLLLEKEGKYVFHGSPENIDILKPRQTYYRSKETGNTEKDGKPAVFATQYADVAIFRALINAKGVSGESSTSRFGINEDTLNFSATRNLLIKATEKKVGKVYVLDKREFQDFDGIQCRSLEAVEPIEVVEVSIDDLPKDIEIIE